MKFFLITIFLSTTALASQNSFFIKFKDNSFELTISKTQIEYIHRSYSLKLLINSCTESFYEDYLEETFEKVKRLDFNKMNLSSDYIEVKKKKYDLKENPKLKKELRSLHNKLLIVKSMSNQECS